VKDDVSSVVHEAELTHTNYEGLVRQVIGMKKRFDESNLHFESYVPIKEQEVDFVKMSARHMHKITKRSLFDTKRGEYL
jgi:hypothetical protein